MSAAAYLSAREAADELGISERTIRRRILNGQLPAERNGRAFRIARATLTDFWPHAQDGHEAAPEPQAASQPTESLDSDAQASPAPSASPEAALAAPAAPAIAVDAPLGELVRELTAQASQAARWQARAELLEAQLSHARAELRVLAEAHEHLVLQQQRFGEQLRSLASQLTAR
jgi:excisionase family DNA binding protein